MNDVWRLMSVSVNYRTQNVRYYLEESNLAFTLMHGAATQRSENGGPHTL